MTSINELLGMRPKTSDRNAIKWARNKVGVPRSMSAKHGGGLFGASAPSLQAWNPGLGDPNTWLVQLPSLRSRTRDASTNSYMYRAIRRTLGDHAFGSTGLVLKSCAHVDRIEGATQTQIDEWNGACDRLVDRYKDVADVTGKNDWGQLCQLMWRERFDGGDCVTSFPVIRRGDDTVVRINIIVAERISNPQSRVRDARAIHGVQHDAWGGPIGFWVLRHHPHAFQIGRADVNKFEYWPIHKQLRDGSGNTRHNALHVMSQDQAGQSRGIPALHTVLDLIDQTPEYVAVTMDAAIQQTERAVSHITEENPQEVADGFETDALARETRRTQSVYDRVGEDVSGMPIHVLKAGERFELLGAQHPGQYHDSFTVRLARTACADIGTPYSLTFNDMQGSSYSSARTEREGLGVRVACERQSIAPACKTWREHLIYDHWLAGEMPAGVDLNGPDRFEWMRCRVSGPKIRAVDPEKEAKADKIRLENKTTSRRRIVDERGGDENWDDIAEELEVENGKFPPEMPPGMDPNAQLKPGEEPDEGDEPDPNDPESEGDDE